MVDVRKIRRDLKDKLSVQETAREKSSAFNYDKLETYRQEDEKRLRVPSQSSRGEIGSRKRLTYRMNLSHQGGGTSSRFKVK